MIECLDERLGEMRKYAEATKHVYEEVEMDNLNTSKEMIKIMGNEMEILTSRINFNGEICETHHLQKTLSKNKESG